MDNRRAGTAVGFTGQGKRDHVRMFGENRMHRLPQLAPGCSSVWALYTIRLPQGVDRDGFAAALKAKGVPTAVYYPKSIHQQTAYRDFPVADGGLPVSEKLSSDVISLPMHAYLDEPSQERVIAAVRSALST